MKRLEELDFVSANNRKVFKEDLNFLIEIQKKIEEIIKYNLYEENEVDHQKWSLDKKYTYEYFPLDITEEIKISEHAKRALLATSNFNTILFTFLDLKQVRKIIDKYYKRHVIYANLIYFDTDMFITLAKYSKEEQIKLREKIISELITFKDFIIYYRNNTCIYLNKILEIININNALFEELGVKWKKDLWNIYKNVVKDFYDSYNFLYNHRNPYEP